MTLREAAQQALEALEWEVNPEHAHINTMRAITALRTALKESEQEPVCEIRQDMKGGCYVYWLTYKAIEVGSKLYAHPPRKPLTDEQIDRTFIASSFKSRISFLHGARYAERAHGIGEKE